MWSGPDGGHEYGCAVAPYAGDQGPEFSSSVGSDAATPDRLAFSAILIETGTQSHRVVRTEANKYAGAVGHAIWHDRALSIAREDRP
ncbi:hypothetical protein ABT187_38090 [Streptomyces sp. NPDC001817]|uniref:hypothetical protein n=1 Tax=Streptomyces sp. NPDC001817 TaxID=3154398 RepID=UPI00331A2DEB